MTLYATLADAVAAMNAPQHTAPGATERADLLRLLRVASRRIDMEYRSPRPVFAPYTETRRFLLDTKLISSWQNTFDIGKALLALTSVTVGGVAVSGVEGYPDPTHPPFSALRLTDAFQSWYGFCASTTFPTFVDVTGAWGVHRDYANAFPQVDALASAIDASATSITVADIDGADTYGGTPRISAGSLLKIDNELLEATATDTTTNSATVIRGVNGTTAAAHDAGAAVKVWRAEDAVRQVVARQAGFLLKRRGAYTTMETDGINALHYPPDLLPELRAVVNDYMYEVGA